MNPKLVLQPLLTRRAIVAALLSGSSFSSLSGGSGAQIAPPPARSDSVPLAGYAMTKNIRFGTALREGDKIWALERAAFLKSQANTYVPGTAALPDYIRGADGSFTTAPLARFLRRAKDDGKFARLHVLHYPKRDRDVVTKSLSRTSWRGILERHFEVIRSVPGAGEVQSIDVINEVVSATYPATEGYRPNAWYAVAGDEYISHAFKVARALWPDASLYFCQDDTEQITDGWRRRHARYVLQALQRALDAGAPIDGYNAQSHLSIRAGFAPTELEQFFATITQSLHLKLIIGELDVRTGYSPGRFTDTRPPMAYAPEELDRVTAELVSKYLKVSLPYLSGGELITWGLTDADNSWTRPPVPPGERPLPWDADFRPKPMLTAIMAALSKI
jgi:endo-1,4-beta-xylanase